MARKKRSAPSKKCPKCGLVQHARIGTCKKCSYIFVTKKKTVTKKRFGKKVLVKRAGGRKKAKRRGRPPGVASGGRFTVADITAAKSLASRVGGASRAKSLLDALG